MRQKLAVLMAPVFCALLGLPTAAQQQEESQLSIERSWATKILKASHPDSVTIRRPKEVEIPPPDERNELPRENRQWLVLRVELKAPPKSLINTEEIKIVGDGPIMYPALGRDWGEDVFVLFAETPAGLVIGRGLNEFMLLGRSPYTGETKLTTESRSPSEISLRFSVPATIQPLYLQIGQGVKVPVPLQ